MPEWIHERARHLMEKNPDMEESTAFAVATQQGHAAGKTPKGYGTPEGKKKAKEKYPDKERMKKTAAMASVGAAYVQAYALAHLMERFGCK